MPTTHVCATRRFRAVSRFFHNFRGSDARQPNLEEMQHDDAASLSVDADRDGTERDSSTGAQLKPSGYRSSTVVSTPGY